MHTLEMIPKSMILPLKGMCNFSYFLVVDIWIATAWRQLFSRKRIFLWSSTHVCNVKDTLKNSMMPVCIMITAENQYQGLIVIYI